MSSACRILLSNQYNHRDRERQLQEPFQRRPGGALYFTDLHSHMHKRCTFFIVVRQAHLQLEAFAECTSVLRPPSILMKPVAIDLYRAEEDFFPD
jgi:hypothetical protein